MNPKYEIHEWIDRYLNGEMDASEKRAFESELLTDAHLAETLEAQKVATKMVIGAELIELKKQMALKFEKGGSSGTGGKAKWYYSAGVLMIASIALFVFLKQKNTPVTETALTLDPVGKEILLTDSSGEHLPSDEEFVPTRNDQKNKKEVNTPDLSRTARTNKKNTGLCTDTLINFSCQARGTCIQKEDGAIEIDVKTIKAGNAPYQFSVYPDNDFKETPILSDLKPGKYALYVKDSKQCLRRLNVEVEVPVIHCGNTILVK